MGGGGENSRDGSYLIMYGGVEVVSGGDFDSSTTHIIGDGEKILNKLFTATGGEKLQDNTGWMEESESHCNWYGIRCNDDGYVNNINLNSNDLNSKIPMEIGILSFLTQLHLNINNLSGSIPPKSATLPALTTLDFSRNHHNGKIPSEIGLIAYLRELCLFANNLNGTIPSEL
eukprot:14412489-Ditylum_brightwellii.AAC.1